MSGSSTSTASSISSAIARDAGTVLLVTWFSRSSMHQAKSPTAVAPTTRPLPLRVWNARRSVAMAWRSARFRFHSTRCSRMVASSSRASSRNTSTNSGSIVVVITCSNGNLLTGSTRSDRGVVAGSLALMLLVAKTRACIAKSGRASNSPPRRRVSPTSGSSAATAIVIVVRTDLLAATLPDRI